MFSVTWIVLLVSPEETNKIYWGLVSVQWTLKFYDVLMKQTTLELNSVYSVDFWTVACT